ncbi:MAG: hypothetical protein ACOZCL_13875 [Bacillota bacterium]
MEELSQEYLLSYLFKKAIDREELLIKKYEYYLDMTRNKELKAMLKEFKKLTEEHVTLMKDKMIKLKIIG